MTWTAGDSLDFDASTIGDGGDEIHLFSIHQARFGSDGRILVALTGAEPRLLQLDSAGGLLSLVGRAGEGPGEFGSISDFVTNGDTTIVWDGRQRRLSVFEEMRLTTAAAAPSKRGRRMVGLVEDSLVVAAPNIILARPGSVTAYEVWNLDAVQIASVDGFTHPQSNLATLGVVYTGGSHTVRSGLPACIAGLLDAAMNGAVYVANVEGAPGRVHVLDIARPDRRLLYETAVRPMVSAALVADVQERFRRIEAFVRLPVPGPGGTVVHDDARIVEDSAAAILDRIGLPGSPLGSAWTAMIADEASGHLWLRRAECEEGRDQEWEVIDTLGNFVARAVVPDSLRVRDVMYPRLLVTLVDSLDVEHLAVIRVHR